MTKNCPTCGAKVEPDIDLPDWLDRGLWNRWAQHRKEIRKKLTPSTIKMQLSNLDKWRQNGHSVTEIINYSISNGYTGLFEPKGKVLQVGKSPDTDYTPAFVSDEEAEAARRIFEKYGGKGEDPRLAGGVH